MSLWKLHIAFGGLYVQLEPLGPLWFLLISGRPMAILVSDITCLHRVIFKTTIYFVNIFLKFLINCTCGSTIVLATIRQL